MSKYFCVIAMMSSAVLGGCVTDGGSLLPRVLSGVNDAVVASGPLTTAEVTEGLKEALRVGTGRVVDQLSIQNGFFGDDNIQIPLPKTLADIQKTLGRVGMDGALNELQLKMNRAAEEAAPEAQRLFVNAVTSMTIEDAMGILNGGDTAATSFLRTKTETQLAEQFKPYIVQAMGQVGALEVAEAIAGRYLPSQTVSSVRNDLVQHAVDGAIEGVFYYLAEEEKAIRNNPAERTSAILKRVFGG